MADLPWLSGPAVPRIFGEYGRIRRDYPIDEYIAEAAPAGVVASVYVQTNWAPDREVDEVAWVQSISDRHGFPHAIVGFADLARADVGRRLEAMCAFPALRGVRQQLHWHANPQYRFASRPDLMNDPAWRHGLSEVARRGLVFELQIFAEQMQDAVRLARDFPGTTFVLMHAGMLADRTDAGWTRWRAGMRGLAACPNVAVKLSGLGTFERQCSKDLWRPVIQDSLVLFGADRCMFGSNFPVEKLWTSYDEVVRTVDACLGPLGARERAAVWHDTAARIYRLGQAVTAPRSRP